MQGSFVISEGADYAASPVEVEEPKDTVGAVGDFGLVLKAEARRYAVTAPLAAPLSLADGKGPLVVQYEVQLQDGLTCGGAYIKLYEAGAGGTQFSAAAVTGSTPYIIMFGPDKCGSTDKVHLILRYENPVSKVWEEKHAVMPPTVRTDKVAHLYTLVIRPDDTFSIKVDDEVEKEGKLEKDFAPSIAPPAMVADPSDHKPADWVDDETIPDETAEKPAEWDETAPPTILDTEAVKPAGWLEDEPEFVAEPGSTKPEGWDDEEDGEWTAPTVANPKCEVAPGCGEWKAPQKRNPAYKGKWSRPSVPNPAYKGEWAPAQIPNPDFYEAGRLSALGGSFIGAVGVEVWTMSGGMLFDNFLITRDEGAASAWAGETFFPKQRAQEAAKEATEHAAKESELAGATFLEKAAFYVEEAVKAAKANPMAAVTVVGTLLAVLLGGLYTMFSSPAAVAAEPAVAGGAPSSRGKKAETVNSAGAVESDDEDDLAQEEAAPPVKAPTAKARGAAGRRKD